MSQLGVGYRYATAIPGVAFDCSGLTAWAWGQAGVGLPHQSGQQFASLPHVGQGDVQPGDLLFFYSPIGHVAMYIGSGQMVHATHPVTWCGWPGSAGTGSSASAGPDPIRPLTRRTAARLSDPAGTLRRPPRRAPAAWSRAAGGGS